MKLVSGGPYLSLKIFPPVDLPPFTLITGLNGAGKSHFLQALKTGHIAVDSAPNRDTDIRIFDWTNMVPGDSGLFDGQTLIQERTKTWQHLENYHQQFELGTHGIRGNGPDGVVRAAGLAAGLSKEDVSDPKGLARLGEKDFLKLLGDAEKAATAKSAITKAVHDASELIRRELSGQSFELDAISYHANKPIYLLEQQDVFSGTIPSWGRADLFQQSFARLFVAYRDLELDNSLRQFQASKGIADVTPLSDEDFLRKHKAPPWIFVNEALTSAGLGFEIDHPDRLRATPYQPTLKKLRGGAEIRFKDLSSGEKIMMSFALCLYYAQDGRQLATYPKVLLLDEVDAPLHPSMSRSLLTIVTDVLVKQHGINVIATTHSASTVAMAPAEAIYTMEVDRPGLHRTTKVEALNILTVGVPTLALSYEGRRQVFVESTTDAELYDRVYRIVRPLLGSERSLEFIGTGTRSSSTGSETHSGCDIVKTLVGRLADAGNSSVFGLVDWDHKHVQSARVAVLASGRRDGIENLVFDPLLVACLVVRDAKKHVGALGLTNDTSYREFLNWSSKELQPVVDRVQVAILGSSEASAPAAIDCTYEGGLKLQILDNYLKMDDHELAGRVLNAFPPLKAFANRAGALMLHVIDAIMQDQPGFIPTEFGEAFRLLLNAPSHPHGTASSV